MDNYDKSQSELDLLNSTISEKLKKSILQEAIQGKLVPQIPEEGTAQELLEQIRQEKLQLVKEGKLKKSAISDSIIFKGDDNKYYEQVGGKCIVIEEDLTAIPDHWQWTRVENIADIFTGNSISETDKKAKYTNVYGREYIGTKDVKFDCSVDYKNGVAIPKIFEHTFKIAPSGAVLMCIEGGSAGRKIAIVNRSVCFGNKLCCFSPYVDISKYIFYYLQSPIFLDMFFSNKTGIIGGVSVNGVKRLFVPLPPQKELYRIVAQIEKLFEQLR